MFLLEVYQNLNLQCSKKKKTTNYNRWWWQKTEKLQTSILVLLHQHCNNHKMLSLLKCWLTDIGTKVSKHKSSALYIMMTLNEKSIKEMLWLIGQCLRLIFLLMVNFRFIWSFLYGFDAVIAYLFFFFFYFCCCCLISFEVFMKLAANNLW